MIENKALAQHRRHIGFVSHFRTAAAAGYNALLLYPKKIDSPFGEVAASSAAAAAHNCPRPVIHLLFIQILCFAMRLAIAQPSFLVPPSPLFSSFLFSF